MLGLFKRKATAPLGAAVDHSNVMIGPVIIPSQAEPTHFLVCGGIGSGKSQTINRIADTVRFRNQPGVVIDPGGELMESLWRPGDIILNPLDARCHRWNLFGEIDGAWDYDRMARVLVPSGAGGSSAEEWRGYSQSLVSAIISRLHKNNESVQELVRLATTADAAELAQFVAGKPAAALTAKGADKMLASVRGILGTALAPWQYVPDNRPAFTFRDWLQNPQGFIWLPGRADHRTLLAPLFSAMIGSFVTALLSMPPKLDRRVWAFLDEMPALGRIEGIERALSEGRKFGLCGVVGFQSVSQVRQIYGREEAQTILAVMRNWVILNQSEPDSAEYFSKALGQQEIIRPQTSVSDNGRNIAYQHATQAAVLPSQLTGLKTRHAYLRVSGDPVIKKVSIPVILFEKQTEPFVRGDI